MPQFSEPSHISIASMAQRVIMGGNSGESSMRSCDTTVPVQARKRRTLLARAVILVIVFATSFPVGSHPPFAQGQENGRKPAMTCEQLGSVKLKDISSISAQSVAAGTFTPTGGTAISNLPPFCRVGASSVRHEQAADS